MRILLPSDIAGHAGNVGPKTLNLRRLQEAGFSVPDFIAMPASEKFDASVVREIVANLTAERYAVRSSALAEDTKHESHAGQFLTKINITQEGLYEAVEEVLNHARAKGHGGAMSIIVQRYVAAAYAGVTFTRSPDGERHMLVEYHRGIGEDIVSGAVKPSSIRLHWTAPVPRAGLPDFARGVEQCKKIEALFGFAQDIEWCIDAGGKWHFLQSRPVTTINDAQYASSLFLDDVLPKETPFLYEKTEISEIAPRPTPLTLSLLERIYGSGGPAERAYAMYGVRYVPRDFLRVIGNELYVDRNEEVQTLLPSFRYGNDLRPKLSTLSGVRTTFANTAALRKIDPGRERAAISEAVRVTLKNPVPAASSPREALDRFLDGYAGIVTINIVAAKALQELERGLAGTGMGAAAVLGGLDVRTDEFTLPATDGLLGNSLELFDTTPFFRTTMRTTDNLDMANWWSALSQAKKSTLQPLVENAAFYDKARECGRFLTVHLVTMLRDALTARRGGDAYFCTLEELLGGSTDDRRIAERKAAYERGMTFDFPTLLTHGFPAGGATVGVSAGIAEGRLVTIDELDSVPGKKILYVRTLSPALTARFGDIEGIVSEHGGLLSHLAIVAREQHLPVVVGFRQGASTAKVGNHVRIDGSTGTVEWTA